MYCVYFHRKKSTNEIFYVGMGKSKRPYAKSGRSKHWKNIVAKHGLIIEIVHDNISWENAIKLEKKYINDFGRINLQTGDLINLTDGGEGSLGCVPWNKGKTKVYTDATIQKMSNSQMGHIVSDESKKKMSLNKIGKKRTTPAWNKGIQLSNEIKKIISNGIRNSEKYKKAIANEERGKKISNSQKGLKRPCSDESRQKHIFNAKNNLNKGSKGLKWYNDGIKRYYLFPDDPKIIELKLKTGLKI